MSSPRVPTLEEKIQSLQQVFTAIPFNQFLNLQLTALNQDTVRITLQKKPVLIGNFVQGILHGGVISAALDMAGGMLTMAHAIYLHSEKTQEELAPILAKFSTVDLHINYLNPGRGEIFSATAQLTKFGTKLAFVKMELTNDKEVLIATASGTYLVG